MIGGTSLELRYGHRNSENIDLFSTTQFDIEVLPQTLEIDYNTIQFTGTNKYMLFCYINNVKTDFVFHPHPLIQTIENIDGIRMFSVADVTAMKLQAVAQRGSKKDFYDVWQLLQIMTPKELIGMYAAKYSEGQVWMLLNSLLYFADADHQAEPKLYTTNLSWNAVKTTIMKAFQKMKF